MAEFVRLGDVAMAALRLRDGIAQGLPPVGKSTSIGGDLVVAIGPDEWLVIADDGNADPLLGRLAPLGGITADVSGNRVRYDVAGPDALWFLSAGCSLDLESLTPGDAVSTLFARAQVIIVAKTGSRFLLLPRRSFARYIEAWAATYTAIPKG